MTKRLPAGVLGGGAKLFLNAQQLVVLGDAVSTAGRTRLDLAATRGHRKVRDEGVFGFARSVRTDRSVAGVGRHADRFQRLSERADLVHLDENRIGDTLVD